MNMIKHAVLAFLMFVWTTHVFSQTKPNQVLIQDVHIFDGKENKLIKGHILIEGNLIKTISTNKIVPASDSKITVVDGQGKYVIPGLIDAHSHLLFESITQMQASMYDYAFLNLFAAKAAENHIA